MSRRLALVAASLQFLHVSASAQQRPPTDPRHIEFKKIQDDIYLGYRPKTLRYWVEGNVTIIVNAQDVVVVDASGTPESARQVIAEIRRLTSNPVRYLINTHGHGDHTIGNQEYVRVWPGVEIVAHGRTAEYITGRGYRYVDSIASSTESRKSDGEKEIARLEAEGKGENQPVIANLKQYYRHDIDIRQQSYRGVTRTPPTLLVSDRLRLVRGERIIEILHFGPGDTPGDLVVYLPKEKLVCTGDMITSPVPFGFSRYPVDWLKTLKTLLELDVVTLIPGHGEVQQGKAYVYLVSELLQTVQDAVRQGIAMNRDIETIRNSINLERFESRFAGENAVYRYYFHEYFSKPNIQRTYDQIMAGAQRNE